MSAAEGRDTGGDGSPRADAPDVKGVQVGCGNAQYNYHNYYESDRQLDRRRPRQRRRPGAREADNDNPSTPAAGTYGSRELAAALGEVSPDRGLPAALSERVLSGIREELNAVPHGPDRLRAERVIGRLLDAHRTVLFLRRFAPEALTTHRLRRALAVATSATGPAADATRQLDLDSEADITEYVVLSTPYAERSSGPRLARFVLELIQDAGLDCGHDEVRKWAASINQLPAYNDELAARRQRLTERRLRLIVSLHYSPAGDWPDALGAWLLYDEEVHKHQDFDCTPDRAGAEEALPEAVDWAMGHADEFGLPLARIDVAAPVGMLLDWRPEEVIYGARLGVDHVVVSRWSQRLSQSPAMRRATRIALRRLHEIAECADGSRLNWLSSQQVIDLSRLLEEFQSGRYTRAIGLVEHPGKHPELLELVLQFSPILLWPQEGSLTAAHQDTINVHWDRLPDSFLQAYRDTWANAGGGPLADVRAVWDDEGWLTFCKKMQVRPGVNEEE
jgi:hypothetical protein